MIRGILVSLMALICLGTAWPANADEGMWLFNQPPKKQLKEKYNFDVTDAWLEHLQKSAVRFNSGGSGSFVSSRGLVMTNHHVGADALQKLSTAERDLLKTGFYAKSEAEEFKCVDLELNVLVNKRFLVTIDGNDIPETATLHESARAMDFDKLAGLK